MHLLITGEVGRLVPRVYLSKELGSSIEAAGWDARGGPSRRHVMPAGDNALEVSLAGILDTSWHAHSRHIREDELGLTVARVRGIKESRGELLVFVDDDNVLASDFLEQAAVISSCYSYLGVFGAGVIQPEFAVAPAPEVVELLGLLALRTVPDARWSNHYEDWPTIQWGAGLCVTREVATHYVELLKRLAHNAIIDRNGEYLYCGGDDLFSWVFVRLRKGFGIFPSLTVAHLIPGERRRHFRPLRLSLSKGSQSESSCEPSLARDIKLQGSTLCVSSVARGGPVTTCSQNHNSKIA
jgi:hypothetical protein